jgi:uncharacterized protein (DUF433 family)
MTDLHRIAQNPRVMDGRAYVRRTHITVNTIAHQMDVGHGVHDLIAEYPACSATTQQCADVIS